MSGIELSANLASGLPERLIRNGTDVTTSRSAFEIGFLPAFLSGNLFGHHSIGHLAIMQGSFPTGAIPTLYSTRSADILVDFSEVHSGSYATNDFSVTNQTTNPALITTLYKAASASGTAAWFMLYQRISNLSGGLSDSLGGNTIIGTVGAAGSGADLEIADTSIVSGTLYRVRNLRLQFPSSWTY